MAGGVDCCKLSGPEQTAAKGPVNFEKMGAGRVQGPWLIHPDLAIALELVSSQQRRGGVVGELLKGDRRGDGRGEISAPSQLSALSLALFSSSCTAGLRAPSKVRHMVSTVSPASSDPWPGLMLSCAVEGAPCIAKAAGANAQGS